MKITYGLIVVALLGAVAGDDFQDVSGTAIPVDFSKKALELKTEFPAPRTKMPEVVFYFIDDEQYNLLSWFYRYPLGEDQYPMWSIMDCFDEGIEISPASKVEGTKTWIFMMQDGKMDVLLDGKEFLTGIKAGEGETKCFDDINADWEEQWNAPAKGVRFVEPFDNIQYRVIDIPAKEETKEESADPDRKEMNAASPLTSGLLLVTAFLLWMTL